MNTLRILLAMLFAFLRPAVTADDPPADDPPADDPPADDPPADDPDADPTADPDGRFPASDPAKELEDERTARAAEKERADRFEREAADLRARHAPRQDDIHAQEDAKLRDPKTPDLEKWQIQANRTLRQNTSAAQMALAQAHDVSDRTAFASLMISDPTAKKYEARVEEELAKVRKAGGNARREDAYTYLLGKDMREGKFKKKAAPADQAKVVARGKLPGARSDVQAKGSQTERQKRAARLENVQI